MVNLNTPCLTLRISVPDMDLDTPKFLEGPYDTIKLLQLIWDKNGSGLEGHLSDFTLSPCPPFTCVFSSLRA